MSQTLTNQPIYAKSMSGILVVSDGVATMENGNLTNLTSVDTDSLTTTSFSANDFQVSTNIDLTGASSQIRFTSGVPANNTLITRTSISTPSLSLTGALNMNNNNITNGGTITGTTITGTSGSFTGALNMNNNNITNCNNLQVSTINGVAPSGAQNLSSVLTTGNSAGTNSINMNNNAITSVSTITATTTNAGTLNATSGSITGALNMNNNNITNVNAITATTTNAGTLNATSGSLTGALNMNNNNITNVNNINLTTINGSVPGGLQNLSSVLGQGNSAGTFSINMNNNAITNGGAITGTTITGTSGSFTGQINMNTNNIINVNELKVAKTTTGVSNPAILLQCDNVDALAENMVVNRYSTTPATSDILFAINVNGRDTLLNSVEYTRISSDMLDPTSTAPKGQMRFYTRGGTNTMSVYEILQLQDAEIDALRLLNMNSNNITNVNQLSINKGTSGITNPVISIDSTSGDATPANIVVNRISSTPASSDELFTINVNGRNNVGGNVEYCRETYELKNVSSSQPEGQIRFYCAEGTNPITSYETLRINNSVSSFFSGIKHNEQYYNLLGNITIPDRAVGGIFYIHSSNNAYTLTLPSVLLGNGAFFTIYNLSSHQQTLSSTANIGGGYGSGATTQLINRGQGYLMTLQGSQWRCIQVFGVPYSYVRYNSSAQTGVSTTNVTALYSSIGLSADNGTGAWNTDTWNGARLTYNAGTFTNDTGFPMYIKINAYSTTNLNSTPRYMGCLPLATRQNIPAPYWYQLATGGTAILQTEWSLYLAPTDAFRIVYQAGASTSFGSATSNLMSRIYITRLG